MMVIILTCDGGVMVIIPTGGGGVIIIPAGGVIPAALCYPAICCHG